MRVGPSATSLGRSLRRKSFLPSQNTLRTFVPHRCLAGLGEGIQYNPIMRHNGLWKCSCVPTFLEPLDVLLPRDGSEIARLIGSVIETLRLKR